MKNTAEAVLFFDRLFDSVNGSRGSSAPGKLRGPVREVNGVSRHVSFWQDAIQTLNYIYYVDPRNSDVLSLGQEIRKQVPSLRNWVTTLNSFIKIWSELKNMGVLYFYTRNLNQDPLENFFGRIRSLNYRNTNPDPYTFTTAFKSLLITDVFGPHSPSSNCEDDMGDLVLKTGLLFNENDAAENIPDTGPPAVAESVASGSGEGGPALLQQVRQEKKNVQSSAYTAGYVSRKLIRKINCKLCRKSMLTDRLTDIHKWISHRERTLLKGKNLKYPNSHFVMLFRNLIAHINTYLESSSHRPHIVKNIRTDFLKSADVAWLGCTQHHSELLNQFIILVCRLQIHNWCNTINKTLRGSFSERLTYFMTTPMQQLALKKYRSIRVKK